MPDPIVLISKGLSVVRRDEIRLVDAMGSSSGDEIVDGRLETLTGVVNQPEMHADRALTMEIEVCPHSAREARDVWVRDRCGEISAIAETRDNTNVKNAWVVAGESVFY